MQTRTLVPRMVGLMLILQFIFIGANAQNAIITENALQGTPQSTWDISGAGDLTVQGFATDISINKGNTVNFKINAPAGVTCTVQIYRIGYYAGNGARLVTTLPNFTAAAQPGCLTDAATGLIDCGNWSVSTSWAIPSTAVSGLYIAKVTRTDTKGASHIAFVVRDDAATADIMFKTSDATWQGYNPYGGNSLYVGNTSYPNGHATKVSYNRPFTTRNGGGGGGAMQDWFMNAEYPMIRWLERNGYNITYQTDVDMARNSTAVTPSKYKVMLSVGHDEYWSGEARAKYETARTNGVHLAFFSGNEVYWKTRWENSIDGSGTAYRTLVCYKEGTLGENVCGGKCDPLANTWTGLWRDGASFPSADGNRPENALTGEISWAESSASITVPATYKSLRFWRNTSIANLGTNGTATLTNGMLGYEWDPENSTFASSYPPGRITMSNTVNSSQTHKISLYRYGNANRALVFGAGTVQWSYGLDATHDNAGGAAQTDVQQATVNLFADMGVSAGSLQSGLVQTTASTDLTAPAATVSSPANGATVTPGSTITISGTASDVGGVVAGVELSFDGGNTWVPATGTTSWTYSWTAPTTTGAQVVLVRGIDDSGNYPAAANATSLNLIVGSSVDVTPPTITSVSATPNSNGTAVITWTTNEASDSRVDYGTASGTLNLNASNTTLLTTHSITITGLTVGTTYYFRVTSKDASNNSATSPVAANSPLSFVVPASADVTPPVISSVAAVPSANGTAVITWTTDEASDTRVDYGTVSGTLSLNSSNATLVTSHSITITGLSNNTTYYFRVTSKDASANSATSPVAANSPLSFTVPAAPTTYNIFATTPAFSGTFNDGSGIELGVKFRVTSAGTITGVRFYKDAGNTGTHTGQLYSSTGTLLASAVFTGETASGWQTVTFTTPVSVVTGTTYVAAYHSSAGNYSAIDNYFTAAVVNGPVRGLADGEDGLNGVYSYTTSPAFPSNAYQKSNYGVDIVFATGAADVTPPVITSVVATPNANGTAVISWTTDEASDSRVDYGTVSGTLNLNASNGTLSTSHSITLTGLANSTTYYFRVTSKDASANSATSPVAANSPASFAVPAALDVTPPVITTVAATPNSNGTAVISWTTDEASDSRVDYGTASGALTLNSTNATMVTAHSISLSGLTPGTTYYFRVTSKDASANSATSPVAANSPATFTVPVVADVTPPVITSVVATPNANGTAVITWTTDEASDSRVDYGTASGTLNLNASNATMTTAHSITLSGLSNSTTYYFTVTSKDASNNSATSPATPANFTVPAAQTNTTYNIFTGTPAFTGTFNDGTPIELGVKFRVTSSGTVTGVRFYKDAGNIGTHTGQLYSSTGTLLASAVFSGETASGWQTVTFATPVTVQPNTTYVAAYFSSAGNYSAIDNYFTTAVVNGPVRGLADGEDGSNGLYQYTTTAAFPTSAYQKSNYGVDIVFSTTTVADVTPPVITNIVATPNSNGTAVISWTTDESSDSRVDYGMTSGALTFNSTNATMVTAHSITLSGLTPGTTYYFNVTSKDASNNSATSPVTPASFTVPTNVVTTVCGSDDTNTNFSAGTLGTTLASVIDSNGALILKPALSEDFTATTIPTGWTAANWNTGGTTTYGGAVTVNGSHIYTTTNFAAGASVEFYAKFSAANNQNVGFSSSATLGAPWVVIGRGTGNATGALYARTSSGTSTLIATNLLNAYHRYKIMWNATNFTIWVDGVQTTTLTFTVTTAMNVHISDNNTATSASLAVDWVRVSPYATSGTFTSRVIDAGSATYWKSAAWNQILPAGTSIAVSYRTGTTATPDGTWSAWTSVANGGALTGNTRYLQYQAVLTTTDVKSTPVLKDISFSCSTAPAIVKLQGAPMVDGTPAPMVMNFDLGQNRPNPTSGSTVIDYTVARTTKVRITVWDMYGRLVKVAEEADREPGKYTLRLDLQGMSKGIYLYRMQADGFSATKRLVIQ